MASSSKASDSSQRSKRSDQGMGKDAAAASVVPIHANLTQLIRQVQSGRLAYIKEKLEVNRKTLQRHSCSLFDVAAAAEVASRGTDGGNALSQRAAERQCGSDLANGIGERDVVSVQEENLATGTLALSSSGATAQRTIVRFVKLPLVEKIPPYTTWIFLDKNQRMADDQSVVGRRRIYYDTVGNEALICSDSDEEIPEPEEEKHFFTKGEDHLIWRATQDHGLNQEVVNVLCQFIGATPSEIEERSEVLFEKNEKHSGSSDKIESRLSLDKTMDAVLDSFDNLFCRRCLVFDCRLHGCSQNLCEKQPYSFDPDENKKPCGHLCYLRWREGFKEMHDDGLAGGATYTMESGTASQRVDVNVMYESEDSNRQKGNIRSMTLVGTSGSKIISSVSAEESTTTPSADISETENVSSDLPPSSLRKHKISKHGPRYREHSPGKRQKVFTSDISFEGNIMNKLSIPEIRDTRLESRESGGDKLRILDESTKKTSRKDMCGESPATTMENVGRQSNKVSSTKNFLESTLSCWSALERDLYLKGIEIFGKNSCLIARNLLSGLKTCIEVANYMYNNGAAMAKRPLLNKSISGDFAENEQDYMEQDMAARTRIYRRRGRNRKLKYTWKSAGHPTVRKRTDDGKQCYTQYSPCACQQMCGKDCPCADKGTCCEKYCGCSKSCKNKFRGCHCAKSQCRSRQCPCFAASRECDPDVCRNCWVSCGDGSLGEPLARGDGYQCGNMKLLLKQQQRILLGRSDVAGWGAFIKNPVNKNDYLGEYTGELISHKEADKRGKIYDRANSSFLFDLNDQYVLDAYRKGDKLKFANHSSNPNCYAKVMLVAGDHRVGIYAKEHIEASEELFYDYRYGPDQAPAWARRPEGSKKDEASVSHRRAHKVAR
ncbi:histone-lysine N-methyltransferase EZ2 isoform X7 [Zea mays]|uniref:histone-lysine N-methyltransferase EZ2 isoform X7 n=1 Tax=Zea mays TaxID=4577 RepID=UPI0009AA9494|nr:histone-lysine N-methyltransferase EZ2 isoform X7 [Zea mays]|eukprot:XP_020399443.1 histone-lysine N-methyltransferase EZ2 isoform X7 [Zea mays]